MLIGNLPVSWRQNQVLSPQLLALFPPHEGLPPLPRGGPADAWAGATAPAPSSGDPDWGGRRGSWSSPVTMVTWSPPQTRQGWFLFYFSFRKHSYNSSHGPVF